MSENEPVRRFGKYELIAHLATGGMAEIYLARQTGIAGFEKLLVIKKILPHLAREDVFVRMFLDEARIAASLNHQNIVQIYDLGCVEEEYFIAMEYLEGESLAEILRQSRRTKQPLPAVLAAGIALQVCEGLHHAHSSLGADGTPLGLVHRDVNPQNIFVLYAGGVKLVDFGIAKAAKRFSETSTGMLKGKYGYMSPEQIMNKPIDARSDIFSTGVVLWEMLTGRKMFRQASELDILKAITEQDPVPPSSRMPGVDPGLDEVTLRALQRSRELRYQSAGEMRMELSFFLKKAREPSDTVAIGEHMQALFYDRMVEKRRLVQHAQNSGSSLEDTLFGDLNLGRSDTEPSVAPDTPPFAGARTLGGQVVAATGTGGQTGTRWKWLALGACGLLAVLVVVVILMWPGAKQATDQPTTGGAAPADAGVAAVPPDAGVVAAADAGASMVVQPVEPSRKKKKRRRTRRRRNRPHEAKPLPSEPDPQPARPGRLRLATQPWTTVYLKERKLGVTPLVDVELPAGRHVLRAVNPGKGIERTIQIVIRPGQTTVKSLKF